MRMEGQKIKVVVNGAKGKMGKETVQAVSRESDMVLAGEADLGDDLARVIREAGADVVVDFTEPACAYRNAQIMAESRAGGVIGTTGFKPEEIQALEASCREKQPGILIAPNFSIGAVLLMKMAQMAARFISDVEIIELHHPGKKDAPSGTAIKTAEMIAEAIGTGHVPRGTSSGLALGEKHFGIPIHSIRLPGLLAHQEVLFGAEGQTLLIRHDALSRSSFMPGVVLAIREVMKRPGFIYGLDALLFS